MAKIIDFNVSKSGAGGPDGSSGKRAKNPDWTSLVHESPWWRLAALLVETCAEGPLKLSSSGELPAHLVTAAWELRDARHPLAIDLEASPDSESQFPSLVEVRTLLEETGVLVANRRSIALGSAGEELVAGTWQLWPLLHQTLRNRLTGIKTRQPGAGPLFRQTMANSLGLINAACDSRPIAADRLIDLLEPALEIRKLLTGAGHPVIQASETTTQPSSGASSGKAPERPILPYEADWYRLVLEGIALPLGLAVVERGTVGHIGAWTQRSAYAVQAVSRTRLLASL